MNPRPARVYQLAALVTVALAALAAPASARKLKAWSKPKIAKLEKECDQGKLASCSRAAYLLLDGWYGAPQDLDKTAEVAKKACDGGDAHGCALLGRQLSYYSNELPPAAGDMFTKACDGNDATGCYWLGRWGKDVEQRNPFFKKAYDLYIAACDGGDAEACDEAAIMNRDSHQDNYDAVVPWDDEAASKLFADACKAKLPDACAKLGGNYEEGRGVTQNDKKAKSFYQTACKLGDSDGCQWLQELIAKRAAEGIRI